jgi:uncharacterized protein (TIGR02996 family)
VDLEHALLQALHDNPTDETSWLVLADWLEEQDDPRAEVLRLQLQLRGELAVEERLAIEQTVRQRIAAGVRPCVPLLINSVGMALALIRPGRFWMGSPIDETSRYTDESPRHEVEITRPFYLGAYQVTQAQYQEVMGHNPSHFQRGGPGESEQVARLDTRTFPVETVSWQDALAFCAALSDREAEKSAGRIYRLPTEAEWEYACRAGTAWSAPFHFGFSLSSRQANFDGTRPFGEARRARNLRRTCAVGSYRPNAFGLYDMHGNVWEWCADWFDVDYYATSPREDPPGPDEGDSRILRGGSFYYIASSCRAAIRFGRRPDSRSNLDGFRVAVSLGSSCRRRL